MADQVATRNSQVKRDLANQLWLHFFNEHLYAQGIISENERNRMQHLIDSRKPSPSKE